LTEGLYFKKALERRVMRKVMRRHNYYSCSLGVGILELAVFSPAVALLSLHSGSTVLQSGIVTSVFKYYGPGTNDIEAPTVLLARNELLCNPDAANVRGKVVVGVFNDISHACNYMIAYRRLDAAGAVGLVVLGDLSPPGQRTFEHNSWDTTETSSMQMTMVEMCNCDLEISLEEATSLPDFRASISSPHDTQWEDVYTSASWSAIMRCIAPLFGLYISFIGCTEVCAAWFAWQHERNPLFAQLRAASLIALIMTSCCSFIIALVLALGSYGPTVCPSRFHKIFFTLFTCQSMTTTSIALIVIKERFRSTPPRNLPLRSLTVEYRFSIVCMVLFGPGGDLALGALHATEPFQHLLNFRVLYGVLSLFFAIANTLIGHSFGFYAYAMGRPLLQVR
jgi:hypothetical protein